MFRQILYPYGTMQIRFNIVDTLNRNSEHYADPTAGGALARISAEQRYAKRREYYRQQAIAKRKAQAKKARIKAFHRAQREKRLANCEYTLAWVAPLTGKPPMRIRNGSESEG